MNARRRARSASDQPKRARFEPHIIVVLRVAKAMSPEPSAEWMPPLDGLGFQDLVLDIQAMVLDRLLKEHRCEQPGDARPNDADGDRLANTSRHRRDGRRDGAYVFMVLFKNPLSILVVDGLHRDDQEERREELDLRTQSRLAAGLLYRIDTPGNEIRIEAHVTRDGCRQWSCNCPNRAKQHPVATKSIERSALTWTSRRHGRYDVKLKG